MDGNYSSSMMLKESWSKRKWKKSDPVHWQKPPHHHTIWDTSPFTSSSVAWFNPCLGKMTIPRNTIRILRCDNVTCSRCNIKSDPVEKWLPGSLFNVKNDSPGHFSTLKADMGQISTLNIEPKVVKKWLPHEILTSKGGHFSTISPHWK